MLTWKDEHTKTFTLKRFVGDVIFHWKTAIPAVTETSQMDKTFLFLNNI